MSKGSVNSPAKSRWHDLRLRAITGFVLIVSAFVLLSLGGLWLSFAVAAVALLIFDEWRNIERRERGRSYFLVAFLLLASFGWLIVDITIVPYGLADALSASPIPWLTDAWLARPGALYTAAPWLAAPRFVALLMAAALLIGLLTRQFWPTLFVLAFGASAIGLSGYSRTSAWIFWVGPVVIVVATDIGAYLFGRMLGGPKLWPRVSPNKTWSGFFGGILAAVLLLCVAKFLVPAEPFYPLELYGLALLAFPWSLIIPCAIILSVFSQAGDLFESALKRRHDVKDSGRLLPGHGGFYDRFDGLSATILILPFLQLIVFYTLILT